MDDGNRTRQINELVEEHYVLLYRFAYRLSGSAVEAEDVTQQVFLTAQMKLSQLRDTANTRAWLFHHRSKYLLQKFAHKKTRRKLSLWSWLQNLLWNRLKSFFLIVTSCR